MKRMILLCLLCRLTGLAMAQGVVITVSNPTGMQRHEVVEIPLDSIAPRLSPSATAFVIRDAVGNEVTWQRTYDGKLLLDASVRPHSATTYTLSEGVPETFRDWVKGRLYPERLDDICWENDRGMYRIYGPALQRTGEKSFGTDLWVKNTPTLMAEERYEMNNAGDAVTRKLRAEGKEDEARENYLATSFHIDHGDGYDPYQVGASLGCGAPALMDNGTLAYPWCFKDYEIHDNGPLRFTVEVVYGETAVGGNEHVVEHRIISLDKGSNFNRMTVWYEGLQEPTDVAAGVVLHEADPTSYSLGTDFVEYADPTDNVVGNSSQVYVACLFPDGISETKALDSAPFRHAVGIRHGLEANERFTYHFGSAWSKYDVRTQAQWRLRIQETLQALREPLNVEIKAGSQAERPTMVGSTPTGLGLPLFP